MLNAMALLFQNTLRSVQNWKKENRPIINLLNKYFTKEELEEFLKDGKITRLELLNEKIQGPNNIIDIDDEISRLNELARVITIGNETKKEELKLLLKDFLINNVKKI